jgi:hypothetical protein
MLLIYTPAVTNRLEYIFDLYFQELLGVEFRLTNRSEEYLNWPDAKINYSQSDLGSGLYIQSTGILFEHNIIPQGIEATQIEGSPVIFAHSDNSSVLSFDPFAAAFYLVTRYKEYLPSRKDKYDRYEASDSIAWKGGFLHTPVVNKWAIQLMNILKSHYPGLPFHTPEYRFIPTIDIDHAYAYRYRQIYRLLGSYARSLLNLDWKDVLLRTEVLLGRKQDPYDNYNWLQSIHQPYHLKTLYFVLFANYGGDDNNVTTGNKGFHTLLRRLDAHSEVGIHPSLSSTRHFSLLKAEIQNLTDVLQRKVRISRQHFLKVNFPKTYKDLIELGVTDDYSMGYASVIGFRAGIACPFFFFDLVANKVTTLRVHPISIMDVTLRDYHHYTPEKALETILQILKEVKSVNGEFVPIWHNESLSDRGRWHGWRKVYEEMVKAASPPGPLSSRRGGEIGEESG